MCSRAAGVDSLAQVQKLCCPLLSRAPAPPPLSLTLTPPSPPPHPSVHTYRIPLLSTNPLPLRGPPASRPTSRPATASRSSRRSRCRRPSVECGGWGWAQLLAAGHLPRSCGPLPAVTCFNCHGHSTPCSCNPAPPPLTVLSKLWICTHASAMSTEHWQAISKMGFTYCNILLHTKL